MRALLDLVRENGAAVQDNQVLLYKLLLDIMRFQILDPELGEEELVESVAAELSKVMTLIANNSVWQQGALRSRE